MNTNIEESDSEFWIEFETNPDLEKLKKGKFFNIPAILNEKIVNFERKLVQETHQICVDKRLLQRKNRKTTRCQSRRNYFFDDHNS